MPKITRIELTNVQAHAHTTLEPAPGLTYLVGPTNVGKSAIVRALRWCLDGGDGWLVLRRRGQEEIQVTVVFDNGWTITRRRAEYENVYEVTEPNGKKHVFDKVGREVPELVRKVTGFRSVVLDREPYFLNILRQHDPLFLITESPVSVHRQLSRLVDTDILEEASRVAQSDARKADTEIRYLSNEIAKCRDRLKDLAWLDATEEILPTLETHLAKLKTLTAQATEMDRLLTRLVLYQQRQQAYDVDRQRAGNIDAAAAERSLQQWEQATQRLQQILIYQQRAQTIQQRQAATSREIANIQARAEQARALLAQVRTCPTCGQPVSPEAL